MSGAMDQAAEIGNLIETAYVALNNPRMDNSNFTVAKDAIEKAHRMLPKELAALRSLIQDLEHPGAWLTLEQLKEIIGFIIRTFNRGGLGGSGFGEGRFAVLLGVDLLSANEIAEMYASGEEWFDCWRAKIREAEVAKRRKP